ncbi:MAG TPA: DUF1801 domain-containing protein [Candidatus Limnocylindrales bacterium]|nr:DUF1801 domain-containing protein [Candidatus Limnocylindrales bacterium]
MRAIPLATRARRRLKLDPPIVDRSGRLDARDAAAARRIAARLDPAAASATAGELLALAALGAVLHEQVAQDRRTGAADLEAAVATAETTAGAGAANEVSRAWQQEFAGASAAASDGASAGASDGAATVGPERSDLAAELLVLAALNDNRAVGPLRELVDDRPLRGATRYEAVVDGIESALGGRAVRPGRRRDAGPSGGAPGRGGSRGPRDEPLPLPARLREPMRRAPGSLRAQLRWITEHWSSLLDAEPALRERVVLALDVLAEEDRAAELRAAAQAGGAAVAAGAAAPDYHGLDAEPEAFSADTEWMPSVVLMAKSTYVWLDQLTASHGRSIANLADVPDVELDRLAGLGVTGLWLIGLWQRSAASADIKRRRGDADAVASAYSIDEYRIADDLGGEEAYADLRERAAARGIRLAADMVPNHMGLDSRWVIEHPERFIQLGEPPFPAYSFTGPNLSPDDRVELRIEDHYWDGSDAAVVFQRRQARPDGERLEGEIRYVYHGNDGTSFPWNDTAQLDYLQPQVREAVIATILDVARRTSIIRFDAAMVLARRHIRRLWYPRPGEGGAIPSRAEHAMSDSEFNRRMPAEFWREVVDRVEREAPGTLLLAEAFWLLEGYFVRTLGMHRVYNSAFMHMLRDEDNAGYRRVMKDTLEFDPRVLQRFVNFMTNPDERPAAEQFGTGDKAFAVATLLATLPGLPMLGHGQVEGWRERYGMEFRRARWSEPVDDPHAGHFEWAIVPLLRRRAEFAGADRFRLYDATADDGTVIEDVYAYSNGQGERRSLVLVHNRYADADVTIDRSAATRAAGGAGRLTRSRLAAELGLPRGEVPVRFRDARSGWETTRTGGELHDRGLRVHLGPYEAVVLDVESGPMSAAAAPVERRTPAPEAAMAGRNEHLDALIDATTDWRGPVAARLRALVHEADPDIEETWKWVTPNRPGTPIFEHHGVVCHLNVLKERVRLTFRDGAALPDPRGLFNVHLDSGQRRGIDIRQADSIDDEGVRELVRAAVRERARRTSRA